MDIGIIRADGRSAPFFEAAARDVLLIRRCADCRRWLEPQATACPDCGAADPPWEPASGRGTLVSWAVPHDKHGGNRGADPAAVLALIELDEGPWLRTRLDGEDAAGLQAGLRLAVRFEHPAEGESYPRFGPEDANPEE